MPVLHFHRTPGLPEARRRALLATARREIPTLRDLRAELCFNVGVAEALDATAETTLRWLLAETFEPERLTPGTALQKGEILEVGPRLSFSTAFSTNAVAICHACGLAAVQRIERSRRFALIGDGPLEASALERFLAVVHDRMTECPYPEPLTSFSHGQVPAPVATIPVITEGRAALERANREMGLAFDDWDLDYYTRLFAETIGRDPTTVECFDIAQSNSEHSRHWFFKGRLVLDGVEQPKHLISMVQEPLQANPNNSVIAFNDNSSSIRGATVPTLAPSSVGEPGPLTATERDLDVIFTAETHNFPSGVAPFPGAETGTGGRIRDVQATGRAGLVVAGTAAYCVGNLGIPGYALPWEDADFGYPDNLATPAGDRDRGLQRRLGLRQQVRRAGDHRLHPIVRPPAPRRHPPRVDQADHVFRRHRHHGARSRYTRARPNRRCWW
jgi:phosphoribosylformylglycinamidine synthase